jgi:hypothetical protein
LMARGFHHELYTRHVFDNILDAREFDEGLAARDWFDELDAREIDELD